jgi:hypothetical protein
LKSGIFLKGWGVTNVSKGEEANNVLAPFAPYRNLIMARTLQRVSGEEW